MDKRREQDVEIGRRIYSFPKFWVVWFFQDEWKPLGFYTAFSKEAALAAGQSDCNCIVKAHVKWEAVEIKMPRPATILKKSHPEI